ncbi:MAG: alpha/beta hydrolase [Bacteroidota bacterium]
MKFFFSIIVTVFFLQVTAQEGSAFTQQEIIYGRKDGMALTMMALTPAANPNGKAIVHVVSGNWVSNYEMLERYRPGNIVYTSRGYTVFMVLHSSQPKYSIIDEVADIKRAVRFIRFNASKYHIDTAHIGITGSSSGGNLSLLVALADDNPNAKAKDPVDRQSARVQAAAIFFPPTDMLNYGFTGANWAAARAILERFRVAGAFDFEKLADSTFTYKPVTDSLTRMQLIKQVSPIYEVSAGDPPVLLVHGDTDFVVPLQQSQSIVKRLEEQNIPHRLIIKKGGGHGWRDMDVEQKDMADWFDTYLK